MGFEKNGLIFGIDEKDLGNKGNFLKNLFQAGGRTGRTGLTASLYCGLKNPVFGFSNQRIRPADDRLHETLPLSSISLSMRSFSLSNSLMAKRTMITLKTSKDTAKKMTARLFQSSLMLFFPFG